MRIMKPHEFDSVFEILEASFPADEYRAYSEQKKLLDDERYTILVDGDDTVKGFISVWEFDTFIFIEHFAVSKKYRNRGIGASVLSNLCKQVNKQLILEVELPETDTAKRRISFYERNGFCLNSFPYEQPAYSQEKQPVPLLIMSYGNSINLPRFEEIKSDIYKEVYKK